MEKGIFLVEYFVSGCWEWFLGGAAGAGHYSWGSVTLRPECLIIIESYKRAI